MEQQKQPKSTASRQTQRAQALLRQALILIAQGHGLARYALGTVPAPEAEDLQRMERHEIPYNIGVNLHREVDLADNHLEVALSCLENAVTNTGATLYEDWRSFHRD